MRFPWQHRAAIARDDRIRAEKRLAAAQANWPVVRQHAAALRHERELNGWTGILATLFANQRESDDG